jgi:hypothetical protein
MSELEALLQGLFAMTEWRVFLTTLVFSVLMYRVPMWRKRVPPYTKPVVKPPPVPLPAGLPSTPNPQPVSGAPLVAPSPVSNPPSVPPKPLPASLQASPSPSPGFTSPSPPPPGLLRKVMIGTASLLKNFLINFPLYSLLLSVYLFFVIPTVINPSQRITFELSNHYLLTSSMGAAFVMMAVYVLALIPKIGNFFNDLHILTFFGSVPIMMGLYTRDPLPDILNNFPLLFLFYPVFTGMLLILLKIGTFLREGIAWMVGKFLFLILRLDGVRAANIQASLSSALAPFFFAGPIFALFIFFYYTHFAPEVK